MLVFLMVMNPMIMVESVKTSPKKNTNPTLLGTNSSISFSQNTFKDDFPIPQAGYVSSLEGIYFVYNLRFKKSGESGDSSSFG